MTIDAAMDDALDRAWQRWLPRVVDAVAARVAAERGAALEPLARVLGCTPAAARMRERRDVELRRLAVSDGRRRLYRRQDVVALLEVRGVRQLRAVGGVR